MGSSTKYRPLSRIGRSDLTRKLVRQHGPFQDLLDEIVEGYSPTPTLALETLEEIVGDVVAAVGGDPFDDDLDAAMYAVEEREPRMWGDLVVLVEKTIRERSGR